MSYFQHKDQRIYMFPESSHGIPLNGAIDTQNPTTYQWYDRLNILPEGLDWDIPKIIKEKIHDIGAGKHASHIINTIQEPVEITLEMLMQDARFMGLTVGTTSSAGTQKVVQTITIDTYSDYVDGDQFLLYAVDASGHQICYQVYMDVTGDDSGKPAAITGATATRIDFVTGDGSNNVTGVSVTSQATLAAEIEAVLEALATITTCDVVGNVITITTVANAGAVLKARDNTGNTGVTTFAITTEGASTQTVTEALDTTLASFGLHIEYNNGSEDIAVDLYGCVVTSYTVNIDFGEKIIKESVTIGCASWQVGTIAVFEPPKKTENPKLWQELTEGANATTEPHVLQKFDGTTTYTDMTPKILNSLKLTIENEVDMHPEIGYRYPKNFISGKRPVSLNLVGFTQVNDLWQVYYDTWDNSDERYVTLDEQINSKIKVVREATYNYWQISIYNWLLEGHNIRLFTIDEKILGIDVTFTDATPDSSGYIIDSLDIRDYVCKIFYGVANA
jgi:hypothetical protein